MTPETNPLPIVVRPRSRRARGDVLLVVGALVAIAGVAFLGGRITAPAAGSAQAGQPGAGGPPSGSFQPGAGNPGGGSIMISGTVAGVSGDTMTITMASGTTVQVSLAGTTFHSQESASSTDVTAGSTVLVALSGRAAGASPDPSASPGAATLAATDVTVIP